ncbi:hypothetical protein ACFX15_007651 [Malus domestica]
MNFKQINRQRGICPKRNKQRGGRFTKGEGNHGTVYCPYWDFVPAGVTLSSKCHIGCKLCGHLAGYHGGEYGKDYKARVVMKKCYRCRKVGHWDEGWAGYIKSERGDWFLKLLAKGCCIRLAQ